MKMMIVQFEVRGIGTMPLDHWTSGVKQVY